MIRTTSSGESGTGSRGGRRGTVSEETQSLEVPSNLAACGASI